MRAHSSLRLLFMLPLLLFVSSSLAQEPLRIAVIVGNNTGRAKRSPLRFAEDDARKTRRVLLGAGGFSEQHVHLLLGKGEGELEEIFGQVYRELAASQEGAKSLVLFYFSGHSDGVSLELGQDRFRYSRLKSLLDGSGATVRVGILDTCLSGHYVDTKGVQRGPAFEIHVQGDLATEGTAILASTARGELAQESGELGGSYFTHHLVSGLYGAADDDGDYKVTLREAYRHTYRRTLGDTVQNIAGAQHPTYSLQLKGKGDLVLSTVTRGSAIVTFPAGVKGNFFLLSLPSREVLAEISQQGEQARRLYVRPGEFRLLRRTDEGLEATTVVLGEGDRYEVTLDEFSETSQKLSVARGGEESPANAIVATYGLTGWFLPEMGAMHSAGLLYARTLGAFELHLRAGYGLTSVNDDGLSYDLSVFEGAVAGFYRVRFQHFDLLMGALLGASRMKQETNLLDELAAWSLNAGLELAAMMYVMEHVAILMAFELNLHILHVDEDVSVKPAPRATLGLGYMF